MTENALTLIFPSGKRFTLSPDQYSPLLTKAALGPGERWITVKPNGPDAKGVPVIIRENNDGTAHVVGGAGGKLNYLKLKGVRNPDEYRSEVAERRKAAAETKKQQVAREKELGTHQTKNAQREQVSAQQREHERAFVKTVAETMGWNASFDPNPYLNLSDGAQKKAMEQHHAGWLKKAKEAVKANRESLLDDADKREEALGEVPLKADAADTISVNDLDPVKPQAGLGYAADLKKEAEKRGATTEAVQAEKQDVTGKEAKPAGEKRKEIAESIARELDEVREPGPKNAKVKLVEAKQAVALLKAEKELKTVTKKAREANKEIDKEVEPKGAFILEAKPAEDADIRQELENDLRTISTRAFLTEASKHGDLGRHIGVGAYNAINAVSLASAGAALLDRQAVDVLGVAGATQVLAARLHADLTQDEMADLVAGLEGYHVDHYMAATEKSIAEALEWQKVAEGIELEAAGNGHDIARMRELNRKRMDAIDNANRILGTTLGEMETNAALLVALKQGAKDKVETKVGNMPVENVIRSARAIGLDRGDYQINSVGSERFLTVNADGLKKLTKAVNRDDLKQVRENLDIMNGGQDEENWLPKGVANRPDLAMRAEPGVASRLAEPFAPGADMAQSVKDYIGGRTADGDAPADIVADLLSQDMIEKAGDKEAYLAALDQVAPMKGADGKMARAEDHQPAFEKMADEFAAARGAAMSPLHRQSFETDQTSVDALHRALSAEPAGVVAFKPVADLKPKDQGALRNWWWGNIGKKDEKAAGLRAELVEHEKAEPEKESVDMFGETATNPAWQAWKQERDEKVETLNNTGLSWAKYADMMGGPAKAYAAVQDLIRGNVTKEFHGAYNTLNPGKPLKLGRTAITGNLNHLDAVDPDAREQRQAEHRSLVDSLRERVAGKYASGAVSDKIDARRQEQAGFEQSQMGFFSSEPEPEKETPLAADQRHTLGQAAEQKLAGMMSVVGQNFKPNEPTRLWQPSMNGKYINQQRAIKLLEKNRRMVLAAGVGSGKTVIMLGGFTHLHAQGKAKRGIFAVPSIVQNQFNGEALRYLEPGKFKWHIEPGASREERLAAYRDPETHFSVVTHQSFRDDMVHLGAKQAGINEEDMAEKVNEMTSADRKTWMRGVMDGAGMDHDFLAVDEGHDLLNRAGKENSLMANVIDAVAHNMGNYVNASADPIKNDSCIHPDTVITDPVRKVSATVSEWAISGIGPFVYALNDDTGDVHIVKASVPFVKSFQRPMYEVVLESGMRITVASEHRFLTPTGWVALSSLSEQQFVAFEPSASPEMILHPIQDCSSEQSSETPLDACAAQVFVASSVMRQPEFSQSCFEKTSSPLAPDFVSLLPLETLAASSFPCQIETCAYGFHQRKLARYVQGECAHRSIGEGIDCLDRCSTCPDRCGEQLRPAKGNGLAFAPSQDDVQTSSRENLRSDGLGGLLPVCSHRLSLASRPSSCSDQALNSSHPESPVSSCTESQGEYSDSGQCHNSHQEAPPSPQGSTHPCTMPQLHFGDHQTSLECPSSSQSDRLSCGILFNRVVSIIYHGHADVYDLTVPGFHNYLAHGIWNHNSEIFGLLHKMDPDRYNDPKAFMRRYGVDTPSSQDELRRELARYFYPGKIDSGKKAERRVEQVSLTDDQHAAVKTVERHLASARLARMKGGVDVAAMRALSPSSFEGVDAGRHEEVAKKLQQNLGILKDTAYRRAINEHYGGAKQEAISRLAKERKGKPGVIFAHSLAAVKQISERLKAEGHRVVTLTGADSSKEKGKKKLAFNPEMGEATADIMVASDAGAVGMNAQRGQWLVQYDTPDTAKAQPLNAKILSPTGWKLMGDIQVGDMVIAGDGTPTKVTGVFPQGEKEIFSVTFSDGAKTECCVEHLWLTKMRHERNRGTGTVRTLDRIMETLTHKEGECQRPNHSIPLVGQVQYDSETLPLDPYVLGVLLGDGSFSQASSVGLSSADPEIVEAVRDECTRLGCVLNQRSINDYLIAAAELTRVYPARRNNTVLLAVRSFGLSGLSSSDKHIPEQYTMASPLARLALLQGLLDTDGTVDKRTGHVSFCSTSGGLVSGMVDIVRSLGGVATIGKSTRNTYTHNGEKRIGRESRKVSVMLPDGMAYFRLPRKQLHAGKRLGVSLLRLIVSVESVGKKPAQCIMVEHPSHLYVTDDFIVTHNTHHQRNGRIDRLGQKNDVELIDLVADHPSERRARDRLLKKDELRGILTSPMEGLDDSGLAAYLNKARMDREQGGLF